MTWYLIILLVVFYIAMWTITSIAFTRWTKNNDTGWLILGVIWPLILISIPFVAVLLFVSKMVDKFGYKED